MKVFAEPAIGEHLRSFGQKSEVLVGGGCRYQQDQNVGYRPVVRSLEGDRRLEAHVNGLYPIQAVDASVGDGDTLAHTGGSDPFTTGQAFDHVVLWKAMLPFHVPTDSIE